MWMVNHGAKSLVFLFGAIGSVQGFEALGICAIVTLGFARNLGILGCFYFSLCFFFKYIYNNLYPIDVSIAFFGLLLGCLLADRFF